MTSDEWQVASVPSQGFHPVTRHGSPVTGCGFTLIEIMVVVALLSLIIVALMGVFSSTQTAFRASITQTDVLEGGRAAMDLIANDLRGASPSDGATNSLIFAGTSVSLANNGLIPVNIFLGANNNSTPLVQSLVASSQQRTNVAEEFFILSRNNQTWSGVGYVVDTLSATGINPLFRFTPADLPARPTPAQLFTNFIANSVLPVSQSNTNMHRLLDGVIGLRVRAYDPNGVWLTNGYTFGTSNTLKNAAFFRPYLGEVGFYMFSNALPASVEIELATLEDRTLQRAGTWPNNTVAQSNYLAQQAGKLHVFRQRVTIPNLDPAAYR